MNADLPPSGIEIVAAPSGSTSIDLEVSSSKLVGECGIEENGLSSSRFRASSSSIGGFRSGDDGIRSPQFRVLVCIWVSVLPAGHGHQRRGGPARRTAERREETSRASEVVGRQIQRCNLWMTRRENSHFGAGRTRLHPWAWIREDQSRQDARTLACPLLSEESTRRDISGNWVLPTLGIRLVN